MDNEIVVIAGPYIMRQVLWYYSVNPRENLIAVVFPYGDGSTVREVKDYCERSGLFKEIIVSDISFVNASLFEKAKQFFKMSFYWGTFRKKCYCEKLIKEYIGDVKYSTAVISSDYSILGGALMQILPKGKIVVLEDGVGDYQKRRNTPKLDLYGVIGYLIAKMGYMNVGVGASFKLTTTNKCIKYSTYPEEMIYRDYCEIRPLFEKTEGYDKYEKMNSMVFEDALTKEFLECDVVFYTSPLSDFGVDFDYGEEVHKWFMENMKGKKIYLKKHPRDKMEYNWDDVDIRKGVNTVPGELLAGCSGDKESIFLYPSTIIMSMDESERNIKVFRFGRIKSDRYNITFDNRLFKVKEDEIINC